MHKWKLETVNKHGEDFHKCEKCNILKKTYKFPKIIGDRTVYCEYIKQGNTHYKAPECAVPKKYFFKKETRTIQTNLKFPVIVKENDLPF